MEISKEQKEAIEYLEKYTKWETYGERNLEKDIITVLGLLKETQIKNETLEELLQGTLYEMYKYYRDLANSYQGNCILKDKVKDKIKNNKEIIDKTNDGNLIQVLKQENEELKEDLKYVLNQTLGAFEKNWCIDWNFTEIREKYNLESEE